MRTEEIIACAASATEVSGVPKTISLMPRGNVTSQKGKFVVDDKSFAAMKAEFERRGNDIVIDYEHQTLGNDQAPAAGWIKDLELTKDAVVAKVEWTPKAQEYLANKEYRYLSPVILTRKSDGRAIALHSAALTNAPAIDHQSAIVNSLDVSAYLQGGSQNMELLKQLAALLGLGEDATEQQVMDKLKEVISKSAGDGKKPENTTGTEVVANKTILGLLGVHEDAKTEDVSAAIMALKNQDGFVPAADFTALKARLDRKDADDGVITALKSGKITPAQKDWATEYALKDPTGFAQFILKAPQIVPMENIVFDTDTKKPTGTDELTLKVCKTLGVTAEDIEKFGKDAE